MHIEPIGTSSFVEYDLLPILDGFIAPSAIERQPDGAIVVRGRLLGDAHAIYRPLRSRFERLGYTPFLRPHPDGVELVAVRGVIERRPRRWLINVVLFVATVITVLLTGAMNELGTLDVGVFLRDPSSLLLGLPFTATLISILFAHEMGHYVVSRWRGAPASLPYFIPMLPGISITGTLGAVIVQREPFEDRKTLLEVAIAGPIAGLVLAIPLLLYGLGTSSVTEPTYPYLQEGNSVLYALAKFAVFGQWLPGNGLDVSLNPIAWGAWIGLLVTMFNLLPVGQLDGGHIAYALFGRDANLIAYTMMGVCLLLGIFVSQTWLVWLVLIALMGPRHPAPFNDVSRLRGGHVALGVIGLVTFLLLFMPNPLMPVYG
jgi:Zn-dependent protease